MTDRIRGEAAVATNLRRWFDLGVASEDPAASAGLRRMMNAVLLFGALPNIPLSILSLQGGTPSRLTAVVTVHLGVLAGLLTAQHRRVRTELVVSGGILWTLCYLIYLEWELGRGHGGTVGPASLLGRW